MVGLGLMACAEFAKVRYAGPAIAVSLGVALLASLTLTPALLCLLGKHVFWPKRPPAAGADLPTNPCLGLWDWVSRRVAQRPGKVWLAAAVILLPLVFLGLRVQPSYRATEELSPRTESLRGLAAIQRHFTAGEVGPITVLLTADEDWSGWDGRAQIAHLSHGFARLPNVAEVRSLTQPLGMALPELRTRPDGHGLLHELILLVQPLLSEFQAEVQQTAREYYVAELPGDRAPARRYVTRIDVILHSDPFEPASAETLRLIQTWLRDELPRYHFVRGPVQAECYGITANGQDLCELTEADRHRVNSLVLAAILLILLALVRRLLLAVYLLVTVLASYYAALGATALAAVLWTGTLSMSLDWRVPFFLFTILVAVGEDYNILLVSRAIEERKRHGGVEGMRRALSRTGGAITSCGLIMAGTFATLMIAGLNTLSQIGFALAFGVLVDTFLVRPFLVPAWAMLFWRCGSAEPVAPASPAEPQPQRQAPPATPWRRAAKCRIDYSDRTGISFPMRARICARLSTDSAGWSSSRPAISVRTKSKTLSPDQPAWVSRSPRYSRQRWLSWSARRETVPSCTFSSWATSRWLRWKRSRRPSKSSSPSSRPASHSWTPSANSSRQRMSVSVSGTGNTWWSSSSSGCSCECRRRFETCQFWNTRMSHGTSGRWPS
jgi:RND superfamily putative drug exporter